MTRKQVHPSWEWGGQPERAPAYAGHQAHPCPVCLNVHGGEITDEQADQWLRANDLFAVTHLHPALDCAECNAAALTERSATR